MPLSPRQLSHLHGEIADGGGPVAARDPLEPEAASRHFCLGHQELSGGRRPLCNPKRTEQGRVRGRFSGKAPREHKPGDSAPHGIRQRGDDCRTWLETPACPRNAALSAQRQREVSSHVPPTRPSPNDTWALASTSRPL